MTNPTCDEVRELAPEVVLGIAGGEERAAVLGHVTGCASCRAYVAALAEAADSLLLLVPPKEPPAGFENRALARMAPAKGGRARRRLVLVAAAALVAGIAAGVTLVATRSDRRLAAHTRDVLAQAGGSYFSAAKLHGPSGPAGEVFAYIGSPSWVFVSLDGSSPAQKLDVQVVMRDGSSASIGTMRVVNGGGNWGGASKVALDDLATIRLVDESGSALYQARFGRT